MYDSNEGTIGRQLVLMVVASNRWVLRRTDVLDFLDYAETRLTSTLEIDLAAAPRVPKGSPNVWRGGQLVPLLVYDRQSHLHAEVFAGGDEKLPRLTRAEERRLVANGITALIAARCDVVTSIDVLHSKVVAAVKVPSSKSMGAELAAIRECLNNDLPEHIRKVLVLFHRFHLVLTLVPEHAQRMVVTVVRVVQHELQRVVSWQRHALSVTLPVSGLNESRSYHVLAVAPLDLLFDTPRCAIKGLDGGQRRTVAVAERGGGRTLHVYVNERTSVTDPTLQVRLRHVRTGEPRFALLSAILSLLVLAVGTLYICAHDPAQIPGESDAAVALLLVVPGLIGSILAVPANHSMTSQLRWQVRLWVGISAVPVFVAAVAVALGWRDDGLILVWGLGMIAAAVATFMLWLQRRGMPSPAGDHRP